MVVNKELDVDSQMLKLIDLGVDDVDESGDGIEVYTTQEKAGEIKELLEKSGFTISSFEIIKKPKNVMTVTDEKKARRIITFLETLEDHEDVQSVFSNLDIPDDVADKIEY
ncbi:hypothetical protein A2W13_03035 [Candidatus Woesebacteria bacterium RBG_16_36_11]|uniref:TACO1/YebC-like second and third domain-containing protein n=1 Tax=Candidatus Woesebacteria bacterium RBG_16_36_11 TaxID=1802481 RepID=A0A1F7XAA6_9BACT|nr:MAG: hypothetical protein A2W13_03035 [Candidatus Woesebacteria bacterium RBG_16_36_11]